MAAGVFTTTKANKLRFFPMKSKSEVNAARHTCTIESIPSFASHNRDDLSLFVCGTYELDEISGTRAGDIMIMSSSNNSIETVLEVTCDSGVLDMKFFDNYLGAAMSCGCLDLYRHMEVDGAHQLTKLYSVGDEDEGLFLSLDFDNRLAQNNANNLDGRVAVSTQQGSVLVYGLSEVGLEKQCHLTGCHSMFGEPMPAWITAFNPHAKHTLLSGGDDCKFKLWDLRSVSSSEAETFSAVHTVKRHTAGVTSAQWHPEREFVFATGSYDECLMVWDWRHLSQPLMEIQTGGGVWRTKWHVDRQDGTEHIVTSSMQGGSRVYRLASSLSGEQEQRQYSYRLADSVVQTDERNSNHLAYGIDVIGYSDRVDISENSGESGCSSGSDARQLTLASCSFYDNLVQTWTATTHLL